MKRNLLLGGIVEGDKVRDLKDIFPEIENSFLQRKTYDEYYYSETKVEVTIDKLHILTEEMNFRVTIYYDDIKID
jgi:hypothetical protein